jgi:hypothetical protein
MSRRDVKLLPKTMLRSAPVVGSLDQMSQTHPVDCQPRECEAFPRQVGIHPPRRRVLTLHGRGVGLPVAQPLQFLVYPGTSPRRDLGSDAHDPLPGILLDDPYVR